jgi:hypothetical protein
MRFPVSVTKTLLSLSAATVIGAGCGNRGVISYRPATADSKPSPAEPGVIEVRFSSLDRITPFHAEFPTGLSIEAPNLDPRSFAPPSYMLEEYLAAYPAPNSLRAEMMTPPARRFEALGAVFVELETPHSQVAPAPFSDVLAPNGKLFQLPIRKGQYDVPISWKSAFATLQKNAAEMGADAVIEVFCAKGVRALFVTPSFVPLLSGDLFLPGGPTHSDWELMGLAVRWKDATDGRGFARARPTMEGDS